MQRAYTDGSYGSCRECVIAGLWGGLGMKIGPG